MRKRTSSKKRRLAIAAIVILAISVAAVVYATEFSNTGKVSAGVHVGDTFTYKLTGISVLGSLDSKTPTYLSDYNNTEYYQIKIIAVNGSTVSFITLWKFNNGTEVTIPQILDIGNGNKTDNYGFWAIYPANLKASDLLRPTGYDKLRVNGTDTQRYADSSRQRNFFQIENQFFDTHDPTGNTQRDDYVGVYFDQQTGMATALTNIQRFNNPQYNIIITYQLISSNVWAVR
jgi:hypothetical protein